MDDDGVKKLARLARLSLSPEEQAAFAQQLPRIVAHVEQLAAVDTTGVATRFRWPYQTAPRRADHSRDDVVGTAGVEQSAGHEDGLVRVPRIVE